MTRFVIPELPRFHRLRNPIPLWLDNAHNEARDHKLLIAELGCDYCIYCGDPAEAGDHLVPEPVSGPIYRALVPIVPACTSCNSILGAFPSPIVRSRADFISHRLLIKYKITYETWAWLEDEAALVLPDEEWDFWSHLLTGRLGRLMAGGVLHSVRRREAPLPNMNSRMERYV